MQGAQVALSRLDHAALRWLSGYADHDLLSDIENAPLPSQYYAQLLLALDSVLVYGDAAVCVLPRLTGPEIVGEVADLLIRCSGLNCVLCAGRIEDDFLISARSKGEDRYAVGLLRRVLRGLGHFGGHRHRAGGKVCCSATGRTLGDLEHELRIRWLDACGCERRRGRRLVRRGRIARRR
jgi:hypothetical protein